MKSFLYKAIFYIGAGFFLSFIVLCSLKPLYWSRRVPIIKKDIFSKSGSNVSIVLGSSHSFYGINCTLLNDNYYNLASISQCLYEDYTILKFFKSKKIKSVILPISYFSNFADLSQASIKGERIRIFDYEHAYNAKYKVHSDYFQNEFNFYTQIAKTIIGFVTRSRANEFDKYGCEIDTCSFTKYDISDSAEEFFRHNFERNFKTRNPILDSIITFCSKNEINLNLVVFPFTKGYQDAIKKNNNEFEFFLNTLRAQQSKKLKFIDCRNLITRNEEIYFRDADHLSPCGRDSLSNYLSNVILK